MPCFHPRTVGFKDDGKTLSWSPKNYSKEYAPFQLPCGKCLACRLDYSRQWAIRCVHEAAMYQKNAFITLTYDDDHLASPKLDYSDFQKFMKKLRKTQNEPVGVFVTGEYGEKTKRPHWHAIVFNWQPSDGRYKYSNKRGDRVFDSETLSKLWGKGLAEYGSVTIHSAGYCARYAAKKLIHGFDQDHDFHPISKKSNKQAIGKRWLEKNYRDVFNHGELVILKPDGTSLRSSIPRYYEKWFKENHPEEYRRYVTCTKIKKIEYAENARNKSQEKEDKTNLARRRRLVEFHGCLYQPVTTHAQARAKILKSKFKLLQDHLKL